jgi:hypothetical protein
MAGIAVKVGAWVNTVSVSGGALGVAEVNLTWANFESELLRVATNEGHNTPDSTFNAFVDYVFFDAAAFNLADGAALDTALTNETMSIADLETYGAAYTP